jgi:sarcosine dehydrogenase
MDQNLRIVVIGGGIWGLSTAFHLAKMGQVNVRVLERNSDIASETTLQAAGLISQIRSSDLMTKAVQYGLKLLSGFREETGYEPGLHQCGSLMLALTQKRMQVFEHQVAQAKRNGVNAYFLSHSEIQRVIPHSDISSVKGAYFVPKDGYLEPHQYALAYAAAAKDLNVQISLNTEVLGFEVQNGTISGLKTNHGFIPADLVAITAGPWSAAIAKQLGLTLSVQPIRHQSGCTVSCPGFHEYHPVVRIPDLDGYLRVCNNGYLYGFYETNPTLINTEAIPKSDLMQNTESVVETINEARERLKSIFPILKSLPIASYRQGVTMFTPDGSYLLGPVPGVQGLFVASGCSSLGVTGAAAIGQWLATWMLQGKPDDLGNEFALERFGKQGVDLNWVQKECANLYSNYYKI